MDRGGAMTKDNRCKEYLGDGVYAAWTGYDVVLTTEDGIKASNTIILEPQVVRALENFLSRLRQLEEQAKAEEERSGEVVTK